ncbi:MAG: endo-1,4-beta-xylanase [Bacteroidota bacterium]
MRTKISALICCLLTFSFVLKGVAQSESEFLVTDFDGGGILPSPWQAYGDLGSYGVQNKRGNSDGKYYELIWNGSTTEGYLVSQSDLTFRLIPKRKLKEKTIDNVYLKMDVNCGGAPGTVINIVLVDGPNDCCANEVNWMYQFKKSTCEWETIEINLGEFGYAYDPNNHEKSIDINKVGRIKVGIDVFSKSERQIIQFDNVALVVKEKVNTKSYQPNIDISDDTTLKSEAKDFKVGVAVNPLRVKDFNYTKIYKREFNSVTAENAMKMRSILKGINANGELVYDWTNSDAIVNFAEANNMNLHGHTLIWHRSIPDFLKNFGGTDQEFESIIEKYITTVVSRYKGKVDSWDVANEVIADGTSEFRESIFLERMGTDYVKKCFQYARNADKDVKLFYNDYGLIYDIKKQQGTFQMIDELLASNLIDGVGYQMHIDYGFPSKRSIKEATNLSVQRELLVHFAELDVRTNPKGDIQESNEQRLQAQGKKVYEVVSVFNAIPKAYKYALTVWGLKDDDSWVTPEYGFPDWPLLFDSKFEKKEAYKGFVQALKEP